MTKLLIKKIDELGFAKYPQIIDDKQIENLLASLSELTSAGMNPRHRRVIHIEFSAETLSNSLKWYGS